MRISKDPGPEDKGFHVRLKPIVAGFRARMQGDYDLMKPFTFRLERMLHYRGYLERRAQIDLYNTKNAYKAQEGEIKELDQMKIELDQECRDEGARGMQVHLYQIYRFYINKLDMDLEKAHRRLKELGKQVKVKETVLKEETIRKKTLENLKDLQFDRFMQQLNKEEQKEMDEVVILRRGGSR